MPIVKPGDVTVVMTEYGPWQGLNAPLGITGFGVNVFCADAGDDIDMEHHEAESNQEEIYVVLAGRAGFTIDGVEHEVGVGTVMGVPDPADGALDPRARGRDADPVRRGAAGYGR